MGKKSIKILGAGLSGLTAAINLAKAGFKVEVYEKSSQVGEHYKENPQLLPNWFSKEDVIEELESCNIKINWTEKIKEVEINLPRQKITFYGEKTPIGYAILRGGENSFETDLAQQAEALGVRIITNFLPNIAEFAEFKPDIIATGFSQLITVGYGRVYKGDFEPNKVKVFFNSKYAPSLGYGYLFPHNKNIATVKISKNITEEKINLKENLKNLQSEYLTKEIKEENFLYDFGTKRSFQIPKSAILGQSLLVGEAAGFQDELFRFGMRYAIISGYLAAKVIIEGLNYSEPRVRYIKTPFCYDKLWKRRFMSEFKKTQKVRRVFEDFKRRNFGNFPEKLEFSMDIERFKKLWLSKKIEFLLASYPLYRNLVFRFPIPKTILERI